MLRNVNIIALFLMLIITSCSKKTFIENHSENINWNNIEQATQPANKINIANYDDVKTPSISDYSFATSTKTGTLKSNFKTKLIDKIISKKLNTLIKPSKINDTYNETSGKDSFGSILIFLSILLALGGFVIIGTDTAVGAVILIAATILLITGIYIFIKSL